MKKFLLIVLILIIFISSAIHASATPPPQIIIWEESELIKLREMVEADENELQDYLRRMNYRINGMTSREDVIKFLNIIDSLPIPYVARTRFGSLSHRWDSQRVFLSFLTDIDEVYSFRFTPSGENTNTDRELLFKLPISQDDYINVYSTSESQFNEHGAIFFRMEMDGFIIRAGYNRGRNNEHITTFNPQEAYKDIIITSFAEVPWSTISISFNTFDALMILRAVAGVAELTEEEAARFEISGAPATADAMRILRIVAGIE
jgi:hypothetical protein